MGQKNEAGLTRRQTLAVAGVAAATGVAALHGVNAPAEEEGSQERRGSSGKDRMPVVFLPHGGGPWPFVEMGIRDQAGFDALVGYLQSVRQLPKLPPKALLVISAHWEEDVPTVMTSERPPILYDYYGFPPESYEITWPAPGQPQVAARVQELLASAGFKTAADSTRGFDHGTFIPLKLTYPAAEIPTVQLSLKRGLDPEEHLAMGRALAPLRDEGIFIVGSGMTFHDLRTMFTRSALGISETFDAWLRETATLEPKERDARLAQWTRAPGARQAHPREEHLLPLMVIAGAAGEERATVPYSSTFMGVRLSAYHFG
ncbi:class III extradiol ring-cleavage dioxygenase [Stigmatella sp. ncwal1]|uniref:Class III extradiol ring-cleavage dioxygenase n=1 Tax=Stigmatella ashevillensis TaxID=2995309 RepID=A0ABT5DHG4_9BACT|nr:class III extradiol ring-cleavage dioxygenase [Stigmatella ashevillena]MDC0712558.1 class III extradiol ring-cleavage dioxygenase [Stigmatella ashevillena]